MLKTKNLIFSISIISTIIMLLVDGVIAPAYWIKSLIKIIFFLLLPLMLLTSNKEMSLKSMFKLNKKGLLNSLGLGILLYVIILIAYFIAGNFFDFNSTINTLKSGGAVNENNFIGIAIYITFINSFLEEFFFRGFAFLNLKRFTSRKMAYIFSALLFSIYHVAMMWNWFSIWLFALILMFLAIGGAIFNYLCEKYDNIYMSWIVHLFANLSINSIGLILLNLI